MVNKKEALRDRLKKTRDALDWGARDRAGQAIHRRLLTLPEFKRAKTVGVYLSKGSEVDTLSLLDRLYERKKTVAAPRAEPISVQLQFFILREGSRDCSPGLFGVWEPNAQCPALPSEQLDLLLVPGLAFDAQGYRLGYGKGYFDRFLELHPGLYTVGLAYEKTFLQAIPYGPLDRPVRCVITEKKIRFPK